MINSSIFFSLITFVISLVPIELGGIVLGGLDPIIEIYPGSEISSLFTSTFVFAICSWPNLKPGSSNSPVISLRWSAVWSINLFLIFCTSSISLNSLFYPRILKKQISWILLNPCIVFTISCFWCYFTYWKYESFLFEACVVLKI